MNIHNCADWRRAMQNGPYAWPGGYPLFFHMQDGGVLSYEAAIQERKIITQNLIDQRKGKGGDDQWIPIILEINWEDSNLYCDHTNMKSEVAYDSENDNEEE